MTDVMTFVASWIAVLFCTFSLLMLFGANFAPNWAKSRPFLLAVTALVVIGSGSFA